MKEADRDFVLELLEQYLRENHFFGKIELNIQNSRIITVNITRGIRNVTSQ